jgi:hypothetical protein
MSWSLKFDEPIEFARGKALRTLRDAAKHVLVLPKRETTQEHWQTAMACLISAAEKRAPVMMARIAMMRAISYGRESSAPEPRRKPAKRYTVIS